MRRKSCFRKFLRVELVLLWFAGTFSNIAFASTPSLYSSSVTRHISHLALVSAIVLPWTISEGAETTTTTTTTATPKEKEVRSGRALKVKSTSPSSKSKNSSSSSSSLRKAKQAGLPPKKTTTNNALLANIDFLTQLTNNKQASESEMDPLKCFPKALCGLSSESAAITRRRKNGLIQDYIRLMKAVSLNPSVMDNILKNAKEELAEASGQVQDDADVGSDSEEDDEEYEEDEDDEDEERKRSAIQKIQRRHSQVSQVSSKVKPKKEQPAKKVKKAKLRDMIPDNSKEFTKMYLQERAHVERLLDDGLHNEDADGTNWWAYESEKDPSLEALVDFSGSKLDSQSQEAYYTYGGKRKPMPPKGPEKPEDIPEPKAPRMPFNIPPMSPPPLPKPPRLPAVKPAQTRYDDSGSSTVGKFFRSLFGFGEAQTFTKDPFFEGFKRSMPDGTPTIVTVDKTREILTTAIEIGETLRSPNQCNSLFNGCKYQYIELLHLIDDIRRSLSTKGKNDFITAEYFSGIDEYTKGTQQGSYGYKSSLSQTSQAETLSQDYKAAASEVATKSTSSKKGKKKSKSYRNGKMSSMSRENSVEIGSDEPTMYGSGQHDGYHQKYGHHHNYNQPSSHNHAQNNFQQSSQYDEMYTRQPKSIWATILSWFGFGR